MTRHQKIVISGGPGAGKTTLLAALAARGYAVVEENARAIIKERMASGLGPRPEPAVFAQEMLRRDIAAYARVEQVAGRVFFDRSALDALGSLHELGVLSAEDLERHLATYRYFPSVLMLPPWPEIYRTDAERDHSFGHAVRVFESLSRWYTRCGYEIVVVPPAPVAERVEFVLTALGAA